MTEDQDSPAEEAQRPTPTIPRRPLTLLPLITMVLLICVIIGIIIR